MGVAAATPLPGAHAVQIWLEEPDEEPWTSLLDGAGRGPWRVFDPQVRAWPEVPLRLALDASPPGGCLPLAWARAARSRAARPRGSGGGGGGGGVSAAARALLTERQSLANTEARLQQQHHQQQQQQPPAPQPLPAEVYISGECGGSGGPSVAISGRFLLRHLPSSGDELGPPPSEPAPRSPFEAGGGRTSASKFQVGFFLCCPAGVPAKDRPGLRCPFHCGMYRLRRSRSSTPGRTK